LKKKQIKPKEHSRQKEGKKKQKSLITTTNEGQYLRVVSKVDLVFFSNYNWSSISVIYVGF